MFKKFAVVLTVMVVGAYASHNDLHQQEKQLLAMPFEHESFRGYITSLCEKYDKRDVSEVLGFSVGTLDEYLEDKGNQQFAGESFTLLCKRKGVVGLLQTKDDTVSTPRASVSDSWQTLFRTAVKENILVPSEFKDSTTIRAYITFLIGERANGDKIMISLLGCYEVDLRNINRLREPELYRMYECFRDFYRYQHNEQLLSEAVAIKEQEMLDAAAKKEAEQKSSWSNFFSGVSDVSGALSRWIGISSPKDPHSYKALLGKRE